MDHLETEARNPASMNLDELTPLQLVELMNQEDSRVIPAIASQAVAIAQGIEMVTERLRAGGRLIYVGAGTSGRLGVLDATECPPTFNSPRSEEHTSELQSLRHLVCRLLLEKKKKITCTR